MMSFIISGLYVIFIVTRNMVFTSFLLARTCFQPNKQKSYSFFNLRFLSFLTLTHLVATFVTSHLTACCLNKFWSDCCLYKFWLVLPQFYGEKDIFRVKKFAAISLIAE